MWSSRPPRAASRPGRISPAELLDRIRAVPGAASAQGLVTVTKVALIGKDGRPITHRRAANELLTYPAAAALAAQFTIRSGRPPRAPGEAMLDAATARSLGYRAGDRIEVVTTAGPQTLTITGITGFGGADSPPGDQVASFDAPTVLVVPVGTAQRLAVLPGRFTEIDVLAAPACPTPCWATASPRCSRRAPRCSPARRPPPSRTAPPRDTSVTFGRTCSPSARRRCS